MDDDRETSSFEVRETDLAGRSGIYTVNGRKVETPELMPVVNPNRMASGAGIPPVELLEEFGFGMIITNSYIIRRSEDLRNKVLEKGLHEFFEFPGVIMTDSGTFQSYIYGGKGGNEVDVDPLEIIRFQNSIGSDVGTILDRFTVPGCGHEEAARDLEITLERARASLEVNGNMEVAVPIQGGRFADLRMRSGRSVYDLGVGYAPIGGVVPIMEGYDYRLLVDVIAASKTGLGPTIPAHLFGAGHPMILPLAVALGCDLFDSASYAKFANDDRYMTRHRTLHLKEMTTLPCSCPVCSRRDPDDLLDMERSDRTGLVSRHNMWTLREVLRETRASLKEGTLWEVVERSALSNPSLFAAVRRLREHQDLLEENSPRTTRRFMASSGLCLSRPEFRRMERRLSTYENPSGKKRAIMLQDWTVIHSIKVQNAMWSERPEGYDTLISTPFGAIPFEMEDMYPVSQSVFPPVGGMDSEMSEYMKDAVHKMIERFDDIKEWDGDGAPPVKGGRNDHMVLNLLKVRSILRMQFGRIGSSWADEIILPEPEAVSIVTSRRTGKIRNVLEVRDDQSKVHLLSLRAEDGHFNLRWTAASRLHESSGSPKFRVVVEDGTGEFNSKGYNVFCKFVTDADPDIRAGDDVLVVGRDDRLHAVGRASVCSRMMVEGRTGAAVKVRDGSEKHEA
ncbi:MAG: tRNA guanosine(15) transglycosylase TgtA [Thermoplasmatota archaeon]